MDLPNAALCSDVISLKLILELHAKLQVLRGAEVSHEYGNKLLGSLAGEVAGMYPRNNRYVRLVWMATRTIKRLRSCLATQHIATSSHSLSFQSHFLNSMGPKRVHKPQLKKKPAMVQLQRQPQSQQMQKVENTMKSMMKWILATVAGTIAAVCPEIHPRGRLIVGSACSGISAELMALDMLNVKYVACFGCECEEHLRRLSGEMHDYCQMYHDVRSLTYLQSPTCDLFVAGFPCQPYSLAGSGRGAADESSGQIMMSLARWLYVHRPKAFVLENVPGLLQRHPSTLLLLMSVLQALCNPNGKNMYRVSWKVLHCRTHGFIPQNRSRLFIVGLRADCPSDMVWPGEAC